MRGASNVEEVLGIAAPELVLLAVFDQSASGRVRHGLPLTLELKLDSVRQLDEVDRVR